MESKPEENWKWCKEEDFLKEKRKSDELYDETMNFTSDDSQDLDSWEDAPGEEMPHLKQYPCDDCVQCNKLKYRESISSEETDSDEWDELDNLTHVDEQDIRIFNDKEMKWALHDVKRHYVDEIHNLLFKIKNIYIPYDEKELDESKLRDLRSFEDDLRTVFEFHAKDKVEKKKKQAEDELQKSQIVDKEKDSSCDYKKIICKHGTILEKLHDRINVNLP